MLETNIESEFALASPSVAFSIQKQTLKALALISSNTAYPSSETNIERSY